VLGGRPKARLKALLNENWLAYPARSAISGSPRLVLRRVEAAPASRIRVT